MQAAQSKKKGATETSESEKKAKVDTPAKSNNNWLKPVLLIVLLAGTILFGAIYIIQTEYQSFDKSAQITPPPPPTDTLPAIPQLGNMTANRETYISEAGKYSIQYPNSYALEMPEGAGESPTSIMIVSDGLGGINSNFILTIRHKAAIRNQTLQQLIDQNPVCDNISSPNGTPGTINGETSAQLFTDTSCGTNVQTVIYALNNGIFYIFSVESSARFTEIKDYVDELISTFKFLDNSQPLISQSLQQEEVYCTQDAKQCADGSWAGRTGSKCEFVCPNP